MQRSDTFFEARLELPRVERGKVFAQRHAVILKALQKGGPADSQDAGDVAEVVRLERCNCGEIEQITRWERRGAMPKLLGQYLGGRFNEHGPAEYRFPAQGIRSEGAAGNEGGFAFGEIDPQGCRFLHVVDAEGSDGVFQPGREALEHLRVAHENVHTGAAPVAMPAHERGASTEAPHDAWLSGALRRIDDAQGAREEALPIPHVSFSHVRVLLSVPSASDTLRTFSTTRPGCAHLPTSCTSPFSTATGASASSARR